MSSSHTGLIVGIIVGIIVLLLLLSLTFLYIRRRRREALDPTSELSIERRTRKQVLSSSTSPSGLVSRDARGGIHGSDVELESQREVNKARQKQRVENRLTDAQNASQLGILYVPPDEVKRGRWEEEERRRGMREEIPAAQRCATQ